MNQSGAAKRRILLVDDNADIQTVITMSLEHFGFEVRCVDRGEQAISIVEEFRPDVAIIDYGLPGMDGIALGARIKALESVNQIRLILFSGSFNPSIKRRADEAGFEDYIVKPIRMQFLKDRLDQLIPDPETAAQDSNHP